MKRMLLVVSTAPLLAVYWAQHVPLKYVSLQNPFEGQSGAVSAGEKLYAWHCAPCHGKQAEGVRHNPTLRSPAMRRVTPGQLFWLLRNGELGRGMPSWSNLPEQQRWQIVSYLKSIQ
jgi:mono/diheme cytochrome c family protein